MTDLVRQAMERVRDEMVQALGRRVEEFAREFLARRDTEPPFEQSRPLTEPPFEQSRPSAANSKRPLLDLTGMSFESVQRIRDAMEEEAALLSREEARSSALYGPEYYGNHFADQLASRAALERECARLTHYLETEARRDLPADSTGPGLVIPADYPEAESSQEEELRYYRCRICHRRILPRGQTHCDACRPRSTNGP